MLVSYGPFFASIQPSCGVGGLVGVNFCVNSDFSPLLHLRQRSHQTILPHSYGSIVMSKVCSICSKSSFMGNRIIRHGLPKKSGGIGLHTTGITRRRFKPNVQKVKAIVDGSVKSIIVCTSCIKAGKVVKA
jgi:large subunit ribosomal protein L28